MPSIESHCHCGNPKPFTQCCLPLIDGKALAKNAEQLMRSRFTAFKLRHHQYIIDTQRLEGKQTSLDSFDLNIDWLGLYLLKHQENLANATQQVEFAAFFTSKQTNQVEQLHELSVFHCHQGRWVYTSGKPLADFKIPRNTPCFCLSGKKYKKCHALV